MKGKNYMKLFKTVDDKLKEIGFVKTKENEYGVEYEKPMQLIHTSIFIKFVFYIKVLVNTFYSLMIRI